MRLVTLIVILILILIQRDVDGQLLVKGWLGLSLALGLTLGLVLIEVLDLVQARDFGKYPKK